MSAVPTEIWPWLALAGLGLFHGLNPAMGWLFAVALGLHRGSQRIVLLSLLPIAVGHAAAVAAVLLAVLALGLVIDHTILIRLAAIVLIAWAAWHALYGHQRRVRVGMQTGLLGLAALGVHSGAMLATIAAVSLIVYHWTGVDFLRRGWVNLDLIWVAVLALCGAILLFA